jgi:hypothetical protein
MQLGSSGALKVHVIDSDDQILKHLFFAVGLKGSKTISLLPPGASSIDKTECCARRMSTETCSRITQQAKRVHLEARVTPGPEVSLRTCIRTFTKSKMGSCWRFGRLIHTGF